MEKALEYINRQLQDYYPKPEIKAFSFRIMAAVCSLDRQDIFLRKDTIIPERERNEIEEIVLKLKEYKPIQYIFKETEFFGMPFYVDENVLIPRPETEELVEKIINSQSSSQKIKILDIGTGSGCIAIALAEGLPKSMVYGLDFSEKAILVAEKNVKLNNRTNVHLFIDDILSLSENSIVTSLKWDVIVSNPPYIVPSEKAEMSANVLDYEPHSALFVPEDRPLLFYEKIADIGLSQLSHNGILFFETGSLYGKETIEMLKAKGYSKVELFQDLSGRDRMIRAER